MGKSIAIMVLATGFSLIGLMAGFEASQRIEPRSEDLAMVMLCAPPVVGAAVGLLVGVVGVAIGSYFDRKPQ